MFDNIKFEDVEFKYDEATQLIIDEAYKNIDLIKKDIESRFVNSASYINKFCRDKRNEQALREEIEIRTRPHFNIIKNAMMCGTRIMIIHKKGENNNDKI